MFEESSAPAATSEPYTVRLDRAVFDGPDVGLRDRMGSVMGRVPSDLEVGIALDRRALKRRFDAVAAQPGILEDGLMSTPAEVVVGALAPDPADERESPEDRLAIVESILDYWRERAVSAEKRSVQVGHRSLTADEAAMVQRIRGHGIDLAELVDGENCIAGRGDVDGRWLALGRTHLQMGLMFLVRAVTRPGHF